MKKSKILMPVMAFVMAIGLAFANKANVQSAGWINLDGVATQLNDDPCNGTGFSCRVTFEDDEQERIFTVYTNQSLQTPKPSSSLSPHSLPEMPD
ncbi:DUF6520 family protein [Zunongwangia sp. F363]|uniref:DUF6520 family protein n=1 Tax=Autumnicola tepida TaxID=3075595 RepID=A0ABU3CE32_9FLAO|nr:DUF6520 family protein [Zunongwangia sp. F363]MDT0644518.1 DUF6520 family protein [Zunongwangia sp. F363]